MSSGLEGPFATLRTFSTDAGVEQQVDMFGQVMRQFVELKQSQMEAAIVEKLESFGWLRPEKAGQLADQRAELLEALELARQIIKPTGLQATFEQPAHVSKKIDAAIANATLQRNATGGEG